MRSNTSKFIIDSGCSDHMVQDINILTNKIDTKLPIITASDEQLTSSAVGDLYVNGGHP